MGRCQALPGWAKDLRISKKGSSHPLGENIELKQFRKETGWWQFWWIWYIYVFVVWCEKNRSFCRLSLYFRSVNASSSTLHFLLTTYLLLKKTPFLLLTVPISPNCSSFYPSLAHRDMVREDLSVSHQPLKRGSCPGGFDTCRRCRVFWIFSWSTLW